MASGMHRKEAAEHLELPEWLFAEKAITEHQDGGHEIGAPEDSISQFIPQDAGLAAPIHQRAGRG